MTGIGATASSENTNAVVHHATNCRGVLLGPDVKDGAVVFDMGKTRIRLDNQRLFRDGEHALGKCAQLVRPLGAVDAQRVDPKGIEGDGGDFWGGAQERTAICLKGHRHEDGKPGVFAAGKDGGLDLEYVGHRLDDEEVGAGVRSSSSLLGECVVCLIEAERAQRAQERAERTDIGGDQVSAGSTSARNGGSVDLVDRGTAIELQSVRPKGVGGDDIAACLDVRAMDGLDVLGVREAEQFGKFSGS